MLYYDTNVEITNSVCVIMILTVEITNSVGSIMILTVEIGFVLKYEIALHIFFLSNFNTKYRQIKFYNRVSFVCFYQNIHLYIIVNGVICFVL